MDMFSVFVFYALESQAAALSELFSGVTLSIQCRSSMHACEGPKGPGWFQRNLILLTLMNCAAGGFVLPVLVE